MEINGQTVNEVKRYEELGLSPELMKALDKKGYAVATPVQSGAIPFFMDWRDVIAKAPTGTGKTFAFGIPMVEHVDPGQKEVQGLVLAPTRELAIQIRRSHREADQGAEKWPPDRGGHSGAAYGPHEAADCPAGQGRDRGTG